MGDQRSAEAGDRQLITRRALAKKAGLAPSRVVALCQAGIITLFAQCVHCKVEISNRMTTCPGCSVSLSGFDWGRRGFCDAVGGLEEIQGRDGVDSDPELVTNDLQEAKVRLAVARAARAEREEALARRDLVPIVEVQRRAVQRGLLVQEAVLAVPDRVSAVLAHERDQARIHRLLDDELRRALTRAGVEDPWDAAATAVSRETADEPTDV